jgi:protein-S-isoprenylcysteine O-methyltransferase Ste14
MTIREKIINIIHQIATGSRTKRTILAPIVGGTFAILTFLFAAIPVYLDRIFDIPGFISQPLNYVLSLPPAAAGIILSIWTTLIFFRSKGTPVPVNPPPKLITSGPYAYTRNPMHTGLFLIIIASGIYFGSLLSLLIFTPVYIALDTLMIIYIEQPELEKRLGEDYIQYKKTTPMFFPWRAGHYKLLN